ncbi:MmgE/PrpD family protein (plasmid) [Paraburkholderia sp. PREW-6R]|uniref:MmgE/PrpD family protein n=1 Tax=Paraburkholderia sp. PREW-6R TaxID=3141544 RepID=UPI0031F5A352
MTNLAQALTECLLTWQADDTPLIERSRLILLDGLAVAAAGATEAGPSLMASLAKDQQLSEGASTVIGHGFSAPAVVAARINGMSMHVLDFEPMWNPPNHAVSTLLPALLALAEQLENANGEPQGEALLKALARGIEAQGRLRVASGQIEPAQLTLHPPGVVGPLAAALACASLLGLESERATAALNIAASRSSGVLANIGSQTKALHCGDADAHGLEAALLAARGFTASPDALSGPRGWGHAYFGDGFDGDCLLAPIGRGRLLEPGLAWKLFPSQFATHYAITAALDVRAQIEGFVADEIERIELHAPSMPYIDRPQPHTGLDGKFSWQYATCVALLDGRVTPRSFSDARRFAPDVSALLERFTLNADSAVSGALDAMHVDLAVHLKSGRHVKARCDAPLGSWHRPVEAEVIVEKARGLLYDALDESRGERVMSLTLHPEAPLAVRGLMDCLR